MGRGQNVAASERASERVSGAFSWDRGSFSDYVVANYLSNGGREVGMKPVLPPSGDGAARTRQRPRSSPGIIKLLFSA